MAWHVNQTTLHVGINLCARTDTSVCVHVSWWKVEVMVVVVVVRRSSRRQRQATLSTMQGCGWSIQSSLLRLNLNDTIAITPAFLPAHHHIAPHPFAFVHLTTPRLLTYLLFFAPFFLSFFFVFPFLLSPPFSFVIAAPRPVSSTSQNAFVELTYELPRQIHGLALP